MTYFWSLSRLISEFFWDKDCLFIFTLQALAQYLTTGAQKTPGCGVHGWREGGCLNVGLGTLASGRFPEAGLPDAREPQCPREGSLPPLASVWEPLRKEGRWVLSAMR